MTYRTMWWVPFVVVGLLWSVGVGWLGVEVLQGSSSFWPALALFGGGVWLAWIGLSIQLIRVPAAWPSPLALTRRHDGLRATWEPTAFRRGVGVAYAAVTSAASGLLLGTLQSGMVSPTAFDRTVYGAVATLAALQVALGMAAAIVHFTRDGRAVLDADVDGVRVDWRGEIRTFEWNELEVSRASGQLGLHDTSPLWLPVPDDETVAELVEVLRTRVGRPDDRLPVEMPAELRTMVEGG